MSIKELVLDVEGRTCDITLRSNRYSPSPDSRRQPKTYAFVPVSHASAGQFV